MNNGKFIKHFQDSEVDLNIENININSYSVLRAINASNRKHRGSSIYFKQSLPLTRRYDLSKMRIWLVTTFS